MALVSPSVELHDLTVAGHVSGAGQQTEAAQVFFIAACLTIAATHLIGEVVEAGTVQTRHQNRTLIILEQAAVFLRDRCAFRCADPENQQRRRLPAQRGADALTFLFAQRRGDQQNPPLTQCALFEQVQRFLHGQIGALAGHRHDRRSDGFQQVVAGDQIIGQRHQGVYAACVDDDGGLCIAAFLQQVQQLASGLFQAGRRRVGGEHLRGELENHHQRIDRFLADLFDALPTGAQQGEKGQQPGEPQRDPWQFAVAAAPAVEQHLMKVSGQQHLPASGAFLPVPESPDQQRQQGRDQQPFRAKPVRPESADHRDLHRLLQRSRQLMERTTASRRCSALFGHNSRSTSSTLNNRAVASGH
ncbi:hypothetical protein ALP48_05461 [Pseudomonas syringae pv. solidagae]|uniref:Uncharacterized protein n=1 Tax=Pseudomonas syringae pv. solidagae TaxID=264458 RepID=A0A3M5KUQ5_PSESX|nr:hypothetical protein ALP48_05461 [Pseudomonas syringae pv. solidagae]